MMKSHSKKFLIQYLPLLIFIGVDLLFVLLDLFTYAKHKSFNLDGELNFPTYYQTVKLYTVSLLSFAYTFGYLWRRYSSAVIRFFWLVLSTTTLYLSIDEVNQLHEKSVRVARDIYGYDRFEKFSDIFANLGFESSKWLLIYAPILVLVLLVFFVCYKQLYMVYKKDMYLLIAVIFFFVLVFFFEMIGTSNALNKAEYHRWVVLEESTEMVSISILLGFVIRQIKKITFFIKD
ncbi:hypothetical protein IT418_02180 [bacterium]|nr:hypothetical protein [bacterium]